LPKPAAPLIAVIEDGPELRADLLEFLEMRGFAARGFGSAEAFFAAWPATRFDLLLLDVALPGVSGLEVARRVRAGDAQAGVVMLTALDANDEQLQGLVAGADVYLSKRSSLEVIEASCRNLLRRLGNPADAPAEPGDGGAGSGHAGLDADARLFAAACRHIDAHLGDPLLTAESLAQALHCSRTRLYQVFAERRLSVARYARGQRLERSRMLLRDLRLGIGEIALHCGYGDLPAFSKAFKRRFGMAPGEWRAAHAVDGVPA